MPHILLVQPPIEDFYLTAKRTVPYGLASIAGSLMEEGFTVEILDGLATSKSRPLSTPGEMNYLADYYGKKDLSPFGLFHQYRHYGYSYQHMAERAARSGARIIGISSLFTAYSECALQCAREIKKRLPNSVIVLGGHHPTELPRAVMECPAVDYVLRGEGEQAMPLLVKGLLHGTPVDNVPGIVFRKEKGELQISPPAVVFDLDKCPLPAHELLKAKHYQRGKKISLTLVGSRGCPFECSYCSTSRRSWITHRRRSVQGVCDEVERASEQGEVGFIDLEDENISLDKKWFMSFLAFVSRRFEKGAVELRAMNGLFPSALDEELIAAMKEAGFKTLNLSLGTTCREQLKRFRRRDVTHSFDRACSLAAKYGLEGVGYILVGAPGQYAADSLKDLLFIAERPVLAGVSVYYPAPGSRDFETCGRLGLLPQNFSLMRSTAVPISHTTTRTEAVTLLRLGRMLNFIKSLVKQGWVPGHWEELKALHSDPGDRTAIGVQLLADFMGDGRIRGMMPGGEVYSHLHDETLAEEFRKALVDCRLK